MKKIKESITEKDYKKLMAYTRGLETIKPNSKQNFLRTFAVLFFSGIRLNEIQTMRYRHIKELLDNRETIIETTKTQRERKIFASDNFIKELNKLFSFDEFTDFEEKVVQKRGQPRSSIGHITYIQAVNKIIHEALGERYSSHSFRQGMITQMAQNGVNAQAICDIIGHSNVQTTLGYIKTTEEDLKKILPY